MTDKCATYRSPLALILPFIISSIIALVVVCLLSFHSAEAKELGTIITVNSTMFPARSHPGGQYR